MSNQIGEPGNPKSFGHEFNYQAWTANNVFTLCNVPWDSEYQNVPPYRSHAALNSFIDASEAPKVSITGTRAKLNAPVKVGMTLAKAMKYNYLRVANGLQPVISGDEPQHFYYFIVGMREVNPELTELYLQLDVWASFFPFVDGVRGFVERGHISMANTKRMQNYGRDYLSIPEGFDTGSEYVGIAVRNFSAMKPDRDDTGAMNVIALLASDPDAPAYKTVDGKQVPNYTAAKGGVFQNLPSGATIRVWESAEYFRQWVEERTATPWQTQSVLSIMLVPDIRKYFPGWNFENYTPKNGIAPPPNSPVPYEWGHWANWRDFILSEGISNADAKYRKLDKFKTSPYLMVELTTFSATPIGIKPENWNDPNATIVERANFMAPNARVQYRPKGYNSRGGVNGETANGQFVDDDGGSYWDMFTQIGAFPTVPLVNDQAILALANQSNGIAYAYQSADWSQQKTLAATQTGYDQATSAMNLNSELLGISQNSAARNNQIQQGNMRRQAVIGMMGGVGQGAGMGALAGPAAAGVGAAGGMFSAIGNMWGTMSQMQTMNEGLVNDWNSQNAALGATNSQAGYIRDSNADLQRFAARGDYENTLAGIKAKIQDTMMTPASVSGQLGGELMNLVNKTMGGSIRFKFIDKASMRAIGDHWFRYGYAVQQYVSLPQSLQVMDRFTYWKLSESYLSGTYIPENYRQALRGILEKGVTIWNDPKDIARHDLDISDNNPLQNVTLP